MKTNNNFHVLVVDDEPFNIELAEAYLLEEGYQISFAKNAQETFQRVAKEKIDLILLDINMPGKDGFEVCKMLKEDSKTKDIPVIFLTAQTDIKYISRAFEVGGVDYLSKPFFGVELKARVKTQLQKVAYLDEIKHKQSKLAQISVTDPLTKLYSALYFDSQIKLYQNRGEAFWLISLKVERFEKINQLYGYYGANKIIRKLAKVLEANSFKSAHIARLFGVSFGILLKDYETDQIKKLYHVLSTAIKKDKEIGSVVSVATVLYSSRSFNDSIPTIYKKIQAGMQELESSNSQFLFIQ